VLQVALLQPLGCGLKSRRRVLQVALLQPLGCGLKSRRRLLCVAGEGSLLPRLLQHSLRTLIAFCGPFKQKLRKRMS
jgi:hypothetical protein